MLKVLPIIWVVAKRHVMMIALYVYLASSGTAIAEPSLVKEIFFVPGQEMSEFFDGRLQNWELRAEKNINPIGTRGPVNGVGENIFEFTTNNVPKFFGSSIKGIARIEIVRKTIGNPGHSKSTANTEDYQFLLPLIPMYIVTVFGCLLILFHGTQSRR